MKVRSSYRHDPWKLITSYIAAHLNPFYLREHSKRIMRGALFNDSRFLTEINVMDYSLVVGVDSQNSELVVGIVGTSTVPDFYIPLLISLQIISAPIPGIRNWRVGSRTLRFWVEAPIKANPLSSALDNTDSAS